MPRSRSPAFAFAFALALAIASPAAADEAGDAKAAAAAFKEGQRAFKAGDYRHAAEQFESAYHAKPHHSPLWNAAQSWEKAGEYVRAGNLYARFLRDAPPDTPDRNQANLSVKDLAKRTGRIELHASGVDKLRLDGSEVDLPVIFVAPGDHVAEGDYAGGVARQVIHVEVGDLVSVGLAPPKPAPVERPPDPGLRRLTPWIAIGGGVLTLAAGGLTVFSGLDSKSKKDAFLASSSPAQTDLDDGKATQTRTNVVLGVTIGLAVVTTVVAVVFTDWKRLGGKSAPALPQGSVGLRLNHVPTAWSF